MSTLRIARLVAAKDLRIERRSRVTLNQVVPFGVLVLVLFSFALDPDRVLDTDRLLLTVRNALAHAERVGENARPREAAEPRYRMVGNSATLRAVAVESRAIAGAAVSWKASCGCLIRLEIWIGSTV